MSCEIMIGDVPLHMSSDDISIGCSTAAPDCEATSYDASESDHVNLEVTSLIPFCVITDRHLDDLVFNSELLTYPSWD